MKKLGILAAGALALGLANPAAAQDWTKSKWGPKDEAGAANHITPDLVKMAAKLVKARQDLSPGHRRRFQDAGVPAAQPFGNHPAAEPDHHLRPRADQDQLQ